MSDSRSFPVRPRRWRANRWAIAGLAGSPNPGCHPDVLSNDRLGTWHRTGNDIHRRVCRVPIIRWCTLARRQSKRSPENTQEVLFRGLGLRLARAISVRPDTLPIRPGAPLYVGVNDYGGGHLYPDSCHRFGPGSRSTRRRSMLCTPSADDLGGCGNRKRPTAEEGSCICRTAMSHVGSNPRCRRVDCCSNDSASLPCCQSMMQP